MFNMKHHLSLAFSLTYFYPVLLRRNPNNKPPLYDTLYLKNYTLLECENFIFSDKGRLQGVFAESLSKGRFRQSVSM